jgi:phage shock protein A
MLKLAKRAWRYLVAAITGKLNELADPKVQIEQAIEEAQRQHELLSQQAAAVLGNRRQLEIKLSRSMDEVEKLQASARQALMLEKEAREGGDEPKARGYGDTAQAFATKLVAVEASMKDLKGLYDQATRSAESAKAAVEQNAFALQKQLAERAKLLSQLEHTKLQERMNKALASMSETSARGDVPNLAEVSDKIEARYARALGEAELASQSVEARMLEVEKATLDAQGAGRLDELRASLGMASSKAPALEEGDEE